MYGGATGAGKQQILNLLPPFKPSYPLPPLSKLFKKFNPFWMQVFKRTLNSATKSGSGINSIEL